MKAALCLSLCAVLAAAVKITPDTVERVIIADSLRGRFNWFIQSLIRSFFQVNFFLSLSFSLLFDDFEDFPNVCYSYTQCRTIKIDEEWDLKPYCGISKCIIENDQLMEMVSSYEIVPKMTAKKLSRVT